MALPSSGAISWGDIRTEFVQSGAFSLPQCYRVGGSSVCPITPGTSGIPSSGTISASSFLGKSAYGTFQTFLAGNMTEVEKDGTVTTVYGFNLNVSNGGLSNGTVRTGTAKTGVKRVMVSQIRWTFNAAVAVQLVQGGNINTIGAPSYASGDINLFGAATDLYGRTLTVYSGIGTGGSVVFSAAINSNGGQSNLETGAHTNPLYNVASSQTAQFRTNSSTGISGSTSIANYYSFTIS
tara:strand:- start:1330 stop:2040 length:711 start_codon:yes stop_codon:yes gene_type:complete